MNDGGNGSDVVQIDANSWRLGSALPHPSTLLLLAANSLPLFGVVYWGWDVFVLLMLYWLETAIIGVWTILRIAVSPRGSLGQMQVNGRTTVASSLLVAGFFVVHSGIFMGVHMVFLWALFSGFWPTIIHGPSDFWRIMIIGTGIWVPLLVLFFVRGFSFAVQVLRPDFIQRLERALNLRPVASSAAAPAEDVGSIIGAFYGRIIVMHLTIIFSAFVAQIFGTITPLILMIAVKTAADVMLQMKTETANLRKTSQTLSAVTSA